MKKMPQIPVVEKSTRLTTSFSGYNHQEVIRDGEMFDTKNLSGDMYPVLSPRKKRGQIDQLSGTLTGINGRDQLTYILGTDVYYNFNKVNNLSVSTAQNMMPKKIVNFGAYVLIWPDKVYFNTVNQADCGSMERLFSITGGNVSLTMCRGDGTDYDMTQITVSATEPSNPTNGKLWIDQSGDNDVLRQYTSATDEWTEVPSVYVKISATGIGSGISEYDAIDISGIEAVAGSTQKIQDQVSALNGSMLVYYAGANYIVVAGLISATQAALKNNTVHADRTIPDMDFVVESNNRLWGCKYGMVNGSVVNEIRCSALGNFRNWKRFMGNSQDSYVASVGTDGPFTGAVTQKSYPVFFKENCIHQVYGQTPSSFQVNATVCRGIQAGSWRSAVVVNETVYYKGREGVLAFDGSMPRDCGEKLGGRQYMDARAGTVKGKYYISMKDTSDTWSLFVYDTEHGTWYREDDFRALGFGKVGDELYAIDEANNKLMSMLGSMGTQEDDFEWRAEFGISGVEYQAGNYGDVRGDIPANLYLSRFNIRMFLDEGKQAHLEIMYDSDGTWTDQGTINGRNMRSFVLPVIPRRCDHLRFRIRGSGDMRIYSIARILEVGADA